MTLPTIIHWSQTCPRAARWIGGDESMTCCRIRVGKYVYRVRDVHDGKPKKSFKRGYNKGVGEWRGQKSVVGSSQLSKIRKYRMVLKNITVDQRIQKNYGCGPVTDLPCWGVLFSVTYLVTYCEDMDSLRYMIHVYPGILHILASTRLLHCPGLQFFLP